jgi:hypothetical protein
MPLIICGHRRWAFPQLKETILINKKPPHDGFLFAKASN